MALFDVHLKENRADSKEEKIIGKKEVSNVWILHLYAPSTYIICYETHSRQANPDKSHNLNVIYLI